MRSFVPRLISWPEIGIHRAKVGSAIGPRTVQKGSSVREKEIEMELSKIKTRLGFALIAGIFILTLGVAPAHANSITLNIAGAPTLAAGVWTYTYNVSVGAGDFFSTTNPGRNGGPTGTFMTLYDFTGYIAGSATAAIAGTTYAIT